MPHNETRLLIALNCLIALVTVAGAEPLSVTVNNPLAPQNEDFHMGASRAPDGSAITIDNESLRLDGVPWAPVMGEFHYTRYPADVSKAVSFAHQRIRHIPIVRGSAERLGHSNAYSTVNT